MLLAALACSSGSPTTLAPAPPPAPGLVADISFPGATGAPALVAPVRATDAETQVGLMYRKDPLRDDEGMLFAFDTDKDHSFWMKNTFIPLDLVFIDSGGTVAGVLPDVPPQSLDSRRVGVPSRFVLELSAGYAARHGLATGQKAVISLRKASP